MKMMFVMLDGVQCNLKLKCSVSVSVQTLHSAFSGPEFVNKGIQVDEESFKDEAMSNIDSGNDISQPIFTSPVKSTTESLDYYDDDDDDFECSTGSSDDSETEGETDFEKKLIEGKKYIVFESELDKLFKQCPQCSCPTSEVSKRTTGSMVTVNYSCINGHESIWNSQPLVNQSPTGNLLGSAAILFSGNTYKRISDFDFLFNLQLFSETTFYQYQRDNLWPNFNKTWIAEQQKILEQMKQNGPVDLVGDGRSDSPGHNAKYGTYTLMEESTSQIVDFQVVQVSETTSSNAMEAEGCKRGLNFLLNKTSLSGACQLTGMSQSHLI